MNLIVVCLLATGWCGQSLILSQDPAVDEFPSRKVMCPDCDEDGKTVCPDCDGKGDLAETCTICQGSGKRPCSVCTKESNTAGPGRLRCPACGGRGTLGTQAKTCNRCQGQQSLTCTTCLGKGTRPCRKTLLKQACPTCRFVGKIECRTCSGKTLISPDRLTQSLRSKEKRPQEKTSQAKTTDGPDLHVVHAGDLDRRYRQLRASHAEHLDVFAEDPRPELAPVRTAATKLLRKARDQSPKTNGAPQANSLYELERFVSRLNNFNRRWGELRKQFDTELKTYRTVEDVWEQRAEVLASGPPRRLQEETARWNQRLDLALRICEKRSASLFKEQPAWLQQEIEDLGKIWNGLPDQVNAYLTSLKRDASSAKEKPETKLVKVATPKAKRRDRKNPALRKSVAQAERKESPSPEVSKEVSPAVRTKKKEKERPVASEQRTPPPSQSSSDRADSPPQGQSAFLWTLIGFSLASLLFFFVGRGRQRKLRNGQTG